MQVHSVSLTTGLAVCEDYLVPQALSSHVSPLLLPPVSAVLSLTSLKVLLPASLPGVTLIFLCQMAPSTYPRDNPRSLGWQSTLVFLGSTGYLLEPSLPLGWPAEPISCSPLPADQWGLSLEFVVREVGPALVGEDLGSGGPVGANNGSGVVHGCLSSSWPHHKLVYLRQGFWVSTFSRADLSQ